MDGHSDVRRRAATVQIGLGLRSPHLAEVLATRPAIGWWEVHAENYMDRGPALARLLQVRCNYPLSLHGVGLSLGSAGGIDRDHLQRLKALIADTEPMLVSEHLSWSVSDGVYLNDLLPLPYTEETLDVVSANVELVQAALGRQILIENPSGYLRFHHSTIPEPQFLNELVRRTGCGLLCDVNNVFVSGANLGEDTRGYIDALPRDAVREIHLAGHSVIDRRELRLLIDDHGLPVCDDVWALFRHAIRRFGPAPSLIERDKNLPALTDLIAEAGRARDETGAEMVVDAVTS